MHKMIDEDENWDFNVLRNSMTDEEAAWIIVGLKHSTEMFNDQKKDGVLAQESGSLELNPSLLKVSYLPTLTEFCDAPTVPFSGQSIATNLYHQKTVTTTTKPLAHINPSPTVRKRMTSMEVIEAERARLVKLGYATLQTTEPVSYTLNPLYQSKKRTIADDETEIDSHPSIMRISKKMKQKNEESIENSNLSSKLVSLLIVTIFSPLLSVSAMQSVRKKQTVNKPTKKSPSLSRLLLSMR